ncbi:MAG TPA: hypothetical protein DD473_03475 [Planctomycetaceae bacterium]|nr:hypothetical protein [Planctomycetaceae bacterium]
MSRDWSLNRLQSSVNRSRFSVPCSFEICSFIQVRLFTLDGDTGPLETQNSIGFQPLQSCMLIDTEKEHGDSPAVGKS